MNRAYPRCLNQLMRFVHNEDAATAIEYALIASVISIGILSAALAIGTSMSDRFDSFAAAFPSATPSP
jgi:pilus assembly protein Flp/PilA